MCETDEIRGPRLEALRAALDAVSEPVLVVDVRGRRVLEANGAACALVGLSREQVRAADAQQALERIGLDRWFHDDFEQALGRTGGGAGSAGRVVSGAAREWEAIASPALAAGTVVLIGRRLDTRQPVPPATEAAGETMMHRTDPLTGLPDRAAFEERLSRECRPAPGGDARGFAVLFLDLDGFKAVNDLLGHRRGDALLRTLAERLAHAVRPGDLVARFGGDEFTVLLAGVDSAADAVGVAQRLLAAIGAAGGSSGEPPPMSASVGIALGRAGMTPEGLIDAADRAMYRAKAAGGGGWAGFGWGGENLHSLAPPECPVLFHNGLHDRRRP